MSGHPLLAAPAQLARALVALSAVAVALAGPWSACTARAAGPWRLSLTAGTTGYDQRALFVSGPELGIRTLAPGVVYDSGPAAWNLRLSAQRKFEFLGQNHLVDGSAAGADRRTADHGALRLRRAWSDWDYVTADATFLRSPDLLDTERGVVVPAGEHRRWDASVAGELLRLDGGYAYSHRDDPSPTTESAAVNQWHLRALPLRGAQQQVFAGFRREQLMLDDALALRTDVLAAGYGHALPPGTWLEIEGGAARSIEPGGVRTRPEAALRITGLPTAPAAVSLAVEFQGDSLASVSAGVSHVLGYGRGWIRAESVPDIDGSVFRAPTRDRRLAVGVEDTLSRATVVGVETSYERVRPLFVEAASTSILRTSIWLIRRIQPWLDGRIGWAYLHQPGTNADLAVPALRRVRLDAELTFAVP